MVQLLCGLAFVAASSASTPGSVSLAGVEKIYVDSLGHDDEAVRFRRVLVENLAAAGFVVVDNRQTSDGVITGFLSLWVHHGSTHASATLALDAPDGRRLWDGEFKERFFSFTLSSDAVKVRAKDVVKRLQKDKEATARPPTR